MTQSGMARTVRISAGLSLREVAGQIQVSPSTVLRWETGERTPRTALALRYGRVLESLIDRRSFEDRDD